MNEAKLDRVKDGNANDAGVLLLATAAETTCCLLEELLRLLFAEHGKC